MIARLLVVLSTLLIGAAAPPAPRPNIVVIVADDLGYGDVGAYGGPVARTPHIDALAAGGVRFTEGYVSAPVCSPSRVALMTGRHPSRLGYDYNPVAAGAAGGLPDGQSTLAGRLQAAGYATGMVGKWHLGWRPNQRPDQRGFDTYLGIASGSTYYPPGHPGVTRVAGFTDEEVARRGAEGLQVVRDGQTVAVSGPLTEAFTAAAVRFIEAPRDRPFFLYLAYNAPHTPLEIDQPHLSRFPADLRQDQRVLAAMVASLDDGVGEVVGALRRRGVERDTLIFFVSDNGCPLYLRGACFNGPLSGGKRHLMEGGLRVPYIVSQKGTIRPGVSRAPVSTLDIAATALGAAAAAPMNALDGQDLRPTLRGARASADRAIFWRAAPAAAIRLGDLKLIRAQAPTGSAETFLFDVVRDVGETRDLSRDRPRDRARLEARLDTWLRTLPPPAFGSRKETVDIAGRPVEQHF